MNPFLKTETLSTNFARFKPAMEDYVSYPDKSGQEYIPNLNGEGPDGSPEEMLENLGALILSQESLVDTIRKKFNISKSFDMQYYDNFIKHAKLLEKRLKDNGARKGVVTNDVVFFGLADKASVVDPNTLQATIRKEVEAIGILEETTKNITKCRAYLLQELSKVQDINSSNDALEALSKICKGLPKILDRGEILLEAQFSGGFIPAYPEINDKYRSTAPGLIYTGCYGIWDLKKMNYKSAPLPCLTESQIHDLFNYMRVVMEMLTNKWAAADKNKRKLNSGDDRETMDRIFSKLKYLWSFVTDPNPTDVFFFQLLHEYCVCLESKFATAEVYTLQQYFHHIAEPILKYVDFSIDD